MGFFNELDKREETIYSSFEEAFLIYSLSFS